MAMVTVTLPHDTNSKWEKSVPADFEVEFCWRGNGPNTFYVIPKDPTQKHLFDNGDVGTQECYTVPFGGRTLTVQHQARGVYTISLNSGPDHREPNPNDGEIIVESVGPGGYEIQVKSSSGPWHEFKYKRLNP